MDLFTAGARRAALRFCKQANVRLREKRADEMAEVISRETGDKEMLEALEELLFRFKTVCLDMDGKTDPADAKRIRQAEAAIRKAKGA
jgi:hypothetical protein